MNSSSAQPRFVDRYALYDVIATGGMASVHLGRLLGPVGFSRTVAIKRLHENFARDAEFVAMFLDEARLVARIRHPNVVQTLDVVASGQELLLVMEYVLGESLASLIKHARTAGRQIPIPVVADIVIGLLNGLHAAHVATNEKGEPLNVVHRDVSPHNVLVGSDGVTRVLDFGIAKAVGHMHQSRVGEVKGKVRYMPPEQISGKDVNRSADIYAASVVLWEALTSSRLFGGGNDAQVVYRVLEGKIPPPSQLRPEVPRVLDEIVLRGLSPNPDERYQTAKAMADALERAAPPVPRSTVSDWVLEFAHDELQRREECLARVESTATPAFSSLPPPAMAAPAGPAAADSTLSRVGSLSQSLAPDPPSPSITGSRRKRVALVLGAAVAIALAGFTPRFFRGSAAAEEQKPPAAAAMAPVAPAPPATETAKPAPAPATAAQPESAPAADPTRAAESARSSARKRSTQTATTRRSGGKGKSFDRIYRRD